MGRKSIIKDPKGAILKKSIPLFAKYGYFAVSIQKIADTCGLKQTSLLYYFRDKDSLLMACHQHLMETNYQVVSRLHDPKDNARKRIHKFALGNLKWAIDYPDQAKLDLLLFYNATWNQSFHQLQKH